MMLLMVQINTLVHAFAHPLNQGLQTASRGSTPAREYILSIMKNNIFSKHLLIWEYCM